MTLKNADDDVLRRRQIQIDQKFMKVALELAKRSESLGEVPVGALVVDPQGQVLSKATNLREKTKSVLGHAELVAIHRANRRLQSWRLVDCTLYVTLEPCLMCAAALVQARIARVVFATHDPKGGALGSLENFSDDPRLNHRFSITHGVFGEECQLQLKSFFKARRKKKIKI